MKFVKLKLFSPIMVKGEVPYENPWDGGDDYRVLIEREKKKCRNEIYVSSCNALTPVSLPQRFESRIYSAVPAIEEKDVEAIGEIKEDNVIILVTVNIPEKIEDMTANMKSPIIINTDTNKGVQVVAANEELSSRAPIYEYLKAKKA